MDPMQATTVMHFITVCYIGLENKPLLLDRARELHSRHSHEVGFDTPLGWEDPYANKYESNPSSGLDYF